jgi:hypothetical protein
MLLCIDCCSLQGLHASMASKEELLRISQWFLVCVLVGLQPMHQQVSSQAVHQCSTES